MDSLKFLLYTLARIGLLLASLALALVFGKIFFPIIASLVPDSMNNLNNFFLSPVSGSVVAWLTMLVLLEYCSLTTADVMPPMSRGAV